MDAPEKLILCTFLSFILTFSYISLIEQVKIEKHLDKIVSIMELQKKE